MVVFTARRNGTYRKRAVSNAVTVVLNGYEARTVIIATESNRPTPLFCCDVTHHRSGCPQLAVKLPSSVSVILSLSRRRHVLNNVAVRPERGYVVEYNIYVRKQYSWFHVKTSVFMSTICGYTVEWKSENRPSGVGRFPRNDTGVYATSAPVRWNGNVSHSVRNVAQQNGLRAARRGWPSACGKKQNER